MTATTRGQDLVPLDPKKLRAARRVRAWSQYELARKSGVSRSFISDIERGTKLPGERVARDLATAMGMKVEDLIVGKKK